jgi:hypothetical protein
MSRPQSPSTSKHKASQLTGEYPPPAQPNHRDKRHHEDSSETWSLVVTGCLAAAMVASFSCRLPNSHTQSWTTILLRSIQFIAFAAAGGAIGLSVPWLLLKEKPSFSFLSKSVAVAWIFFPCITLFYRQQSPWMFLVLTLATIAVALSLRRLFPPGAESDPRHVPSQATCEAYMACQSPVSAPSARSSSQSALRRHFSSPSRNIPFSQLLC